MKRSLRSSKLALHIGEIQGVGDHVILKVDKDVLRKLVENGPAAKSDTEVSYVVPRVLPP